MPEIIGWGSALILLPAFGLQTYRQWKNRHEPVNPSALWFFVLVLIGTGGQVAYSWMVRNWVYLALNSALVVNNGVGLGIAIRRGKTPQPTGVRHSHSGVKQDERASVPDPATPGDSHHAGFRGHSTMNSEEHDEQQQGSDPSREDREAAGSSENHSDVVTTTDPAIASGRGEGQDRSPRPDETIVAETSRVTRAVPSYVPEANAFVEPERPGNRDSGDPDDAKGEGRRGKSGGKGQARDSAQDRREDHDRSDDRDEPAHAGHPGWMSYVVTGVVALVCGVGGAWAFSHFEQSKKDDQSQKGGDSQQAKKGGASSSKKDDSSRGHAKGQTSGGGSSSDSGSEIPGFTSAEDADILKKQIEHISSRVDTLQQQVESMAIPRNIPPPDIGTLQIKMGEISRTVGDLTNLPSQSRQMANRLDRLQEEIRSLRDQLSAAKERGGLVADTPTIGSVDRKVDSLAGPPPAPPTSIRPSAPDSPDEAMAVGIALFKKGQYPQADDIFRKLQLTRPQDARVWYYSALAHGFATGEWEGDTRRFVVQGADRERAGLPSTSQIDTAFDGLSAAQGKDWLASYFYCHGFCKALLLIGVMMGLVE